MQSTDWNVLFDEIARASIILGLALLGLIIIASVIFWAMARLERKTYLQQLYARHEELWNGRASTELWAWLQVQWELEQQHVADARMDLVKQCIRECRRRHEKYRQIMLKTGRIIKVTRPRWGEPYE